MALTDNESVDEVSDEESPLNTEWYVGSGCSSHMTGDKKELQ
ncbi:hypothetical protein LINPERPRIM_LOCUS20048, partial [Linum perenne]